MIPYAPPNLRQPRFPNLKKESRIFVVISLTKRQKHVFSLLITVILAALLAIGTAAFSETYGENREAADLSVALSPDPVSVTLVKNGVEHPYTYFPVTCSDFLLFADVTLTPADTVNVSADTVLYDNMMIDVSTVEYSEVTEEVPMPYENEIVEVDTIPKGTYNVLEEGADGVKRVTYLVKTFGGEVVMKEVVAEDVITPPVRGKVEYGVGGTVTSNAGVTYNYSYVKIMEATAYTYVPGLTTWTTATGARLDKGIVAVDPRVIPLHTQMFITSDNFEYGYGKAEDTGGVIKGNIVDLAFLTYDECIQFGRRNMRVYILE